MAYRLLETVIPWFLVVLFITQMVIPLILNKKMFWLFRKSETEEIKKEIVSDLEAEIEKAKEVSNFAKEKAGQVKSKVDDVVKSAEDLKKKTEGL